MNLIGVLTTVGVLVGVVLLVGCDGSSMEPDPPALALSIDAASVQGGQPVQGLVTLSGGATSGNVTLTSSNSQAASVPGTVTINPSGGATSGASFTISTSAVTTSATVTITASFPGASPSPTATLVVNPPAVGPVTLTALTLSAATVFGGSSVQGTVTLSGPAPAGGTAVALSSNDTNGVLSPALQSTVTVAAGATSATFPVSTRGVGGTFQIVISASLGGVTRTANLRVDVAPTACTFTITDTATGAGSRTNIPSGGGTFGINIVASPSSCSWATANKAGTPAGMITINGAGTGTGNGGVGYGVSQNTTGAARSGGLQVNATGNATGSAQFNVTQNP